MATVNAYPAGGTFLDTLKKSFTDVPVDKEKHNAISTTEFLEAAESLTTLFDVLGSVAFTPVKSDMLGNIKKIRDRQLAAPLESATLQDLVINELKTKKHTATEGLVWLVRYNPSSPLPPPQLPHNPNLTLNFQPSALDFTSIALSQNIAVSTEELSTSFRNAYGNTLKPFHGFLIKPVFSAAMSACPYRADFYAKLGVDQDQVLAGLRVWLSALETILAVLKGFLDRKEAKW
ncbi:Pleckstrin homology domain-containing family A member [Lachnellula hyalina]|uniref:Pleckstrin homology domain-containing family A member n=1 Tax=Lachnellula hyalina TaxID=1316788 RepID=A0A8H8QTZ8_9HELO|nr:Pleckstrin homology domain-containing family A member [Lachnellula hyalina]TVY22753.1 Pleckstrin homology domain-containing family A member [Lachnellula hyalina]